MLTLTTQVPGTSPLRFPALVKVATSGLLQVQLLLPVTSLTRPFASVSVAVIGAVCPTLTCDGPLTLKLLGGLSRTVIGTVAL